MITRVSKALAAGVLAAGVFGAVAAPTAHAATTVVKPQDTVRRHVCAQDVYVRETAAGVSIGLLTNGDTFDQERLSPSGEWAYGMAYGHVNQHGWVLASALC
jgi:hypothetical protein